MSMLSCFNIGLNSFAKVSFGNSVIRSWVPRAQHILSLPSNPFQTLQFHNSAALYAVPKRKPSLAVRRKRWWSQRLEPKVSFKHCTCGRVIPPQTVCGVGCKVPHRTRHARELWEIDPSFPKPPPVFHNPKHRKQYKQQQAALSGTLKASQSTQIPKPSSKAKKPIPIASQSTQADATSPKHQPGEGQQNKTSSGREHRKKQKGIKSATYKPFMKPVQPTAKQPSHNKGSSASV